MKRVLSIVFQFFLYLLLFAAGSFLPAFHLLPAMVWHLSPTRDFVITGLLMATALYVLLMIVHALRRTQASAFQSTTIAFLLAAATGLLLHFGMLTV